MKNYTRITILLKDSKEHNDYNQRILEYLNDRHAQLNDAGFAIAIEVVDNSNINTFIKSGISSIPALIIDENIEYGVNSIISKLAKLEIVSLPVSKANFENSEDSNDVFMSMIMEEMTSDEQETDGAGSSTIKMKNQDYPEAAMDSKDIDQKMSAYEAIYKDRAKKNPMSNKRGPNTTPPKVKLPTARENVEKLIAAKNYDKGEAQFMREIAQNLQY